MQNAVVRVPALEEMGVVKLINGPRRSRRTASSCSGRATCADSGSRRASAPRPRRSRRDGKARRGVDRRGHALAGRLAHGLAPLRRRLPLAVLHGRAHAEVYETYYDVKYPGHERRAGRPLRISAANAQLSGLGAVFGEKSGWERANWFEPNAAAGDESLRPRGWAESSGRPRSAPSTAHAARRGALRRVVLRQARRHRAGAADFLESLCANRVAQTGRVTYTQMLNPRGGIECDFTVTRLGPERFRIVTGTAFGQHDAASARLAWSASTRPTTAPSTSST